MNDWEKKIVEEAMLLCRANCRAKNCADRNRCLNTWPGPGGFLSIFFKEARERVMAKLMDTA